MPIEILGYTFENEEDIMMALNQDAKIRFILRKWKSKQKIKNKSTQNPLNSDEESSENSEKDNDSSEDISNFYETYVLTFFIIKTLKVLFREPMLNPVS